MSAKTLQKISIEKLKDIVPEEQDAQSLSEDEPVYEVVYKRDPDTDDLVGIEVALRKAKRVGAIDS